jgi:hypothetical protein
MIPVNPNPTVPSILNIQQGIMAQEQEQEQEQEQHSLSNQTVVDMGKPIEIFLLRLII